MKDGKYEVSDLSAIDHIRAIVSLLVYKGLITLEEYEEFRDVILKNKNEQLDKELQGNAGLKFVFDMLKK